MLPATSVDPQRLCDRSELMDCLPRELSEDECAALEALASRKALPDLLTPSQLVALAYPDQHATRERRSLLHAICAALDAAELKPAVPPRTLADLPPQIAARWTEQKPPFNPRVIIRHFSDVDKSFEAEELRRGDPQPDFSVPIRREDFLYWARSLGLRLPGFPELQTLGKDVVDVAHTELPTIGNQELRAKRAEYGKAGQASRKRMDWRPLVTEARELIRAKKLTASDAARCVARKHGLTGCDTPHLSKQAKTLANKLTEGGSAN